MPRLTQLLREARGWWLPILLLVATGCSRAPEGVVDLVAELEAAERLVETQELSLAVLESGRVGDSGWAPRIKTAQWRWAYYPSSAVEFIITEPRPVVLELRGRKAPCLGDRGQVVIFEVNGVVVDERRLERAPAVYRLQLGSAALRPGENVLRLRYSAGCRLGALPLDVAAGWDSLRIPEARAVRPPWSEPAGESAAILLPFGSQVSFYLALPSAGRLAIARVDPWGVGSDAKGAATVLLEIQVADSSETATVDLLAGSTGRDVEVPVPGGSATPVRLTLRPVRGAPGVAGDGGFRLRGPVVRYREPGAATARHGVPGRRRASEDRKPNIVVYLVDTLRADHLGAYGYDRPTSPEIDAFAREATLFSRAKAQTSWTRPAVATLFTGLNPLAHGVNERDHALGTTYPVMAQLLRQAGYQTIGITTNVNVFSSFGFDRGFDHYEELPYVEANLSHQSSEEVNRSVFRWLDQLQPDRPFFLYVHTADPHAPYDPPDIYRRLLDAPLERTGLGSVESLNELRRLERRGLVLDHVREQVTALYDAEIAHNDASFGSLLAELRRRGLYESSLVIFLSDHGEAFGAHGEWTHGKSLYADVLDIPLILKLPGGEGAGEVSDVLARQEDLLPTVLGLVGEEAPGGARGHDLLSPASRGSDSAEESLSYLRKDGSEIEGVLLGGWKLIRYRVSRRPQDGLFHVSGDLGERVNLIDRRTVWRGFLDSQLRRRRMELATGVEAPEVVIDPEQLEELRALGYLR